MGKATELNDIAEDVNERSRSSEGDADSQSMPSTTTGNRVSSTTEHGTGTGDHSHTSGSSDKIIAQTLIKSEERAVQRTRILVSSVIVICAIAVCVSIYIFGTAGDQRSFELEYERVAKDIGDMVRWEIRYNFALMEQLSADMTSKILVTNATMPFYTDPHYEITGGYADGMGGIMAAGFAPFVKASERREWEQYAQNNQWWLAEAKRLIFVHPSHTDALHGTFQDSEHDRALRRRGLLRTHSARSGAFSRGVEETMSRNGRRLVMPEAAAAADGTAGEIAREIFHWVDGVRMSEPYVSEDSDNYTEMLYAPLWQVSPPKSPGVMANLLHDDRVRDLYEQVMETRNSIMSPPTPLSDLFGFLFDEDEKEAMKNPHAIIVEPISKKFEDYSPINGILVGLTSYKNLVYKVLPEGTDGIYVVFENSCGDKLTFDLEGPEANFLAYDDVHEASYNNYRRSYTSIEMYPVVTERMCIMDVHVYPSARFQKSYDSNNTVIYACVATFAVVIIGFLLVYDSVVSARHKKTMATAAKTQAIVQSLFPKEIGNRLIQEANEGTDYRQINGKHGLKSLLVDARLNEEEAFSKPKPMADLFPNTTIMFADLAGFTAWSSTREPTQVFTLLETIYSAFDEIAQRRAVFKVETVGDCYVAVSGCPDSRRDHPVVMARFARDCLYRLPTLLRDLEVELGPDTAELGLRVGLHSGPVTAGVLRGDRARFQLFGDTMNTTARIEATGIKNRIHISNETAQLLIAARKEHWIREREDEVEAKGKGRLKTWWLDIKGDRAKSEATDPSSNGDASENPTVRIKTENNDFARIQEQYCEKEERLVNWMTDVLAKLLREIVARREAKGAAGEVDRDLETHEKELMSSAHGVNPLEEVQSIISLPQYDDKSTKRQRDPDSIQLGKDVVEQLREFVRTVAALYRKNPFHNFEHASHVAMSVVKLLSRIIAPDLEHTNDGDVNLALHDHTYGITSDPLTQFAVVLSALLHDVDHTGVPNSILITEQAAIAAVYKNKSVAEQNSVDIAWDLLMEDKFKDLRYTIYTTTDELKRFRQLVLATILATDIMDKELNAARKARWNLAFSDEAKEAVKDKSARESVNRKATIVIEHLIQASDVAHTMQHWHIYRRWNARLFEEMYLAYKTGRSPTDPSENWYKGEIGFFDFYIIPLAKKLKSCGVFGVSSDEYLTYAEQNRQEWEMKGQEIVAEMLEQLNTKDTDVCL